VSAGYPSSVATQNAPKKQAVSAACEREIRDLGPGQIEVLRGGYDLRGVERELAEFILELEVGGIVIQPGESLPSAGMPEQTANNDNAPASRKRAA
jgi:hypothetical protein